MKATLYSSPLRPLPERFAIGAWVILCVTALGMWALNGTPWLPAIVIAGVAVYMAVYQWKAIAHMVQLQRRLNNIPLLRMTTEELQEKMNQRPGSVWLGKGFVWRQQHAQMAHELVTEQFPHLNKATDCLRNGNALANGALFVHGIGLLEETDVYIPVDHQAGHTFVIGTTGAGKTRLLDILASQCIFRGEAVVVFDPKGDRDLADSLRRSCEEMGDPDRFVYFHPGFPSRSALIDPLRNYNRESELSSRIAALINDDSSVFTSFAWMALAKVISGLLMTHQSPNLVSLRRLLDLGPDQLLSKVFQLHFDSIRPDWRSTIPDKDLANHDLRPLIRFYRGLDPDEMDSDLDGLVNMVEHNREHFGKMIASLMPVLTMLTSGSLRELLSPTHADPRDPRVRTDIRTILKERKVLYVGLDSLSDAVVGSAIGSMLLSDLTSVAGDLYNRGAATTRPPPVNVYIDEAAEVMNTPTIQLLNKGRGAGMRLTVLTQTIADLEARLGSSAKARQVLGNMNNQVILRTLDGASQKYLAENMPETVLYSIERSQSNTSGTVAPSVFSGSFSERTKETSSPLIGAQITGLNPNLHYFAKMSGSMFFKVRIPILSGVKP